MFAASSTMNLPIVLFFILLGVSGVHSSAVGVAPATLAAHTAAPTTPTAPTEAPTTPQVTSAPTIPATTTCAPTLPAATTAAPTLPAATTAAPTTPATTTAAPTTPATTTAAPTTPANTTAAPTTPANTTAAPTTPANTTAAPTTPANTTAAPTTPANTTAAPTTPANTTAAPTTPANTTAAPTTAAPTTAAPTTSTPTDPPTSPPGSLMPTSTPSPSSVTPPPTSAPEVVELSTDTPGTTACSDGNYVFVASGASTITAQTFASSSFSVSSSEMVTSVQQLCGLPEPVPAPQAITSTGVTINLLNQIYMVPTPEIASSSSTPPAEVGTCANSVVIVARETNAHISIGATIDQASSSAANRSGVIVDELVLVNTLSPSSPSVTYNVTFNFAQNISSAADAQNQSVSPFICACHASQGLLFSLGNTSSPGLERVAELGNPVALLDQLKEAMRLGEVGQIVVGLSRSALPSVTQMQLTVSPWFPLMSCAAALQPSPDWFVGAADVDLRAAVNQFAANMSVPLHTYDAGTDAGQSFQSEEAPIFPQPITLCTQQQQLTTIGSFDCVIA